MTTNINSERIRMNSIVRSMQGSATMWYAQNINKLRDVNMFKEVFRNT